jgi:quercetin dioxygenase-like cupin family protein
MYHAGVIELYTGPTMHAHSVEIAPGGRLEERAEAYDSLVIALADSKIREVVSGGESSDWDMKTGETRWIPKGTTHSETNIGSAPAALIVFEFN